MNASHRSAQLAKAYKVLRKYYNPVAPPTNRPLLDHLLYACCLQNARFEDADDAFAKLQQSYFDWNEIRVTTVSELAEVMSSLPDAAEAAARLRRCLQTVFETYYSFDLELLKKQTIGQAIKELQKCNGICPFAIAYATQHGLGGHAIPLNRGALGALLVLGIISESESKAPRVPGLERAISKSKGVEFGSLLHQLGADFYASPFSARLRAVLLEIDPDSKQRLPKRAGKKAETVEAVEEVENGGCEAAPAETSVEAVPAPSDAPAPPLEPTISEPAKSGGKPKKKNASPPETDSADSGKNKPPTKRIAQRKPR